MNVYPDENRGSAALTIAAITLIRRAFPGCRVTLVPINALSPSLKEFRHTREAFPDVEILPPVAEPRPRPFGGLVAVGRTLLGGSPSARLVRKRVAGADLVVSRGGVIFRGGDSMRAAMSLWLRLVPMRYALSASVPLVLLGAHIDPFPHRFERWMVSRVFRRAARVLPRDDLSATYAAELGASTASLTPMPDSVFALLRPAEHRIAELVSRYELPRGRFLAVALSPSRNEPRDDRLVQSFATAIRTLVDAGRIEAVAVCVQAGGRGGRDELVSRRLLDRLDGTRAVLVADDDLSPEDLAALYGGAAVVIGRRMHACILSLIGGTPALAVELANHKTRAIWEDLGLAHLVVPREDALEPVLVERSIRSVLDDPNARREVDDAVARARSRLDVVAGILATTPRGDQEMAVTSGK